MSGLLIGAAALLAALGAGCGPPRYTRMSDLSPRRHRNLLHVASQALVCPAAGLQARVLRERLFRVTGCGRFRDYALIVHYRRRHHDHATWREVVPVEQRAQADLGCAVEVAYSRSDPSVARARGCGQIVAYELRCGAVDCGWLATRRWADPAARVATSTPTPPPSYPSAAEPSTSGTPTEGAAERGLRAFIDDQRVALLACVGGRGPMAISARWSPDAGVVLELLPPHAGTPAEACARALLSQSSSLPSSGSGQVVHVVTSP